MRAQAPKVCQNFSTSCSFLYLKERTAHGFLFAHIFSKFPHFLLRPAHRAPYQDVGAVAGQMERKKGKFAVADDSTVFGERKQRRNRAITRATAEQVRECAAALLRRDYLKHLSRLMNAVPLIRRLSEGHLLSARTCVMREAFRNVSDAGRPITLASLISPGFYCETKSSRRRVF